MSLKNFQLQVWSLAVNVWMESIRDRLVHVLTGTGIIMLFFSLVLGDMTLGGHERVIQNTGFWVLGIWGLLAVMYLGSNILRHEFKLKTVYLIVSRPVNRQTFLIGKFFGMVLVLTSLFIALFLTWVFLMGMVKVDFTSKHLIAVVFIYGEWLLLAAISLFFASFTSPMLHNFFLVAVTFLGHWSNDIRVFSENAKEPALKIILKGIYYALPNLEALSFREAALYNETIPWSLILIGTTTQVFWLTAALVAAILIFMQRRLL